MFIHKKTLDQEQIDALCDLNIHSDVALKQFFEACNNHADVDVNTRQCIELELKDRQFNDDDAFNISFILDDLYIKYII